MSAKREITRADIIDMAEYGRIRREHRRQLTEFKRQRRMQVGPYLTFLFESYETMWAQVHEMLYIEGGGEEQIPGELEAYNPLIPKGREIVATLLIEIPDPDRRAKVLMELGHIDDAIFLSVGGQKIKAQADDDQERNRDDGKTSSVHFLRFAFTDEQVAAFRKPGAEITLESQHPRYGHMARMEETVRQALSRDFE